MPDAQIVYFHGLPGGGGELDLFGRDIAARTSAFHVVDRSRRGAGSTAADHFAALAGDIRARYPATPLRLIGFSLGAAAALRTAVHLGDQIRQIDLVSAAAPLDLGDYLDGMAGAPVFRIAAANRLAFGMLTAAQGLMARRLPERLFAMLFASAQGADSALAASAAFREAMQPMLRAALNAGRDGYRREILHYVDGWAEELDRVEAPVALFHGADDNWSPVAMAGDLASRLKHDTVLTIWPGLSHYSALRAYLDQR